MQQFAWLTEPQFLDAVVAVAMITPGPVVITVVFIGFLVAGLPGATAAAIGIFLPVYVIVAAAAVVGESGTGRAHSRTAGGPSALLAPARRVARRPTAALA